MKAESLIAFMGLPWPMNMTGMRGDGWSEFRVSRVAACAAVLEKTEGSAARLAMAAREALRCINNLGEPKNGCGLGINVLSERH